MIPSVAERAWQTPVLEHRPTRPRHAATEPDSPSWSPQVEAVGVVVYRLAGQDGAAAAGELSQAVAAVVGAQVGQRGVVRAEDFHVVIDLFDRHPNRVRAVLAAAAAAVATTAFALGPGPTLRLHVGTGWSGLADRARPAAVAKAQHLAAESLLHNDLVVRPVLAGDGARSAARAPSPLMTGWQVVLSLLACVAVPLALLILAFKFEIDLAGPLYWIAVGAIVVTVGLQCAEGVLALRRCEAPAPTTATRPPATAIIAAYLPNEAATIVETISAFRALDYAADLQIILAYNTDRVLPVQAELAEIARQDPRVVLLQVDPSTSKAQNVNAALAHVTGEFVGIFDADHHPMPDSFERAWRWLAAGNDVVQGHCVVRNGDQSAVARMVAVEFEQIYAVGHIGRQRMHGFGIFGGSSGFWRTEVLRTIRMRGDRLTEDIDSSVRALRSGYRVINDRGLISRELAPTTWKALWKQRIRWAQGWHEVSRFNWRAIVRDDDLTMQQRFGLSQLLLWRELYMWVTPLIWALLLFGYWRDGSVSLSSPVLLVLTAAVVACGPIQLLIAYRVGDQQIRRHGTWWWSYALVNVLLFQEYKNLIGRVAQLKHAMGERHWTVTPRTAAEPVAAVAVRSSLMVEVG